MAKYIKEPSTIAPAGNKPKIIKEFFGRVNTGQTDLSIAKMESPEGWEEPSQSPEFDEYTIVLKGALHVETKEGEYKIESGEAISLKAGEWVRYSSPYKGGAEYVAVCNPAFSPDTVNRED